MHKEIQRTGDQPKSLASTGSCPRPGMRNKLLKRPSKSFYKSCQSYHRHQKKQQALHEHNRIQQVTSAAPLPGPDPTPLVLKQGPASPSTGLFGLFASKTSPPEAQDGRWFHHITLISATGIWWAKDRSSKTMEVFSKEGEKKPSVV